MTEVHLSIVSHRQGDLAARLLSDLQPFLREGRAMATVVLNVPERLSFDPAAFPNLQVVVNDTPLGFSANQNRTFQSCAAPYFCVLNPDLRIPENPFPRLLAAFKDDRLGVVAPSAADTEGRIQDNARRLPSPLGVIRRALLKKVTLDYPLDQEIVYPDWIAGFFMLFRASAFRAIGGFNARYFLYYEDAEICCRLMQAGYKVAWMPRLRIVHDARRSSRSSPRYLAWHASSILRFFGSPTYRAARRLRN
jgi:N-acetylglucosaminyl-diphospho-decaprenol L-rhamnosyltransferase